jgi:tripartite-type tricarboxylate transporter receptor subunit TctC
MIAPPRRALLAAALATPALAQSPWPNRPIRIVVTLSPGSTSDILARLLADELSRDLRQQVIIENRPGAGGNVAAEYVMRAAPDGYTLLLASVSSHGINPALISRMPYDALADFTPVANVGSSPNLLIVAGNSPWRSTAELVAAARAAPGRLNFSSGGIGTSHHLSAELLNAQADITTVHVPYRGSPEAVTAVQTGEVAFMFPNAPNALALAAAGQLRILGVTTRERASFLPEVPTLREQGFSDFEVIAWFGLVGPANMPGTIVAQLNTAVREALARPALAQRLAAQSFEPLGGTSEAFSDFIRAEITRWRALAQARNLRID